MQQTGQACPELVPWVLILSTPGVGPTDVASCNLGASSTTAAAFRVRSVRQLYTKVQPARLTRSVLDLDTKERSDKIAEAETDCCNAKADCRHLDKLTHEGAVECNSNVKIEQGNYPHRQTEHHKQTD